MMLENTKTDQAVIRRDEKVQTLVEKHRITSTSMAVGQVSLGALFGVLGMIFFLAGLSGPLALLLVGIPLLVFTEIGTAKIVIPEVLSPVDQFSNAIDAWAKTRCLEAARREAGRGDVYDSEVEIMAARLSIEARKALTPQVKRDLMLRKPVEIVLSDYSMPTCFEDTDHFKSYQRWEQRVHKDLRRGYITAKSERMQETLTKKKRELNKARKSWEEAYALHQRAAHSRLRFDGKSITQHSWTEVSPASLWLEAVDNALDMP